VPDNEQGAGCDEDCALDTRMTERNAVRPVTLRTSLNLTHRPFKGEKAAGSCFVAGDG
jgi:hypothetical protein